MPDIEQTKRFQQRAMAVDIELAVFPCEGSITEEPGRAATAAAWPYVERAIQAERERAKVMVEALHYIRDNGYYHPDYVSIINSALAAYRDST